MNIRHRLAPQMIDYDRIGYVWRPFLMYFHTPSYRSPTVNTDQFGFRYADGSGGRKTILSGDLPSELSILAGGSTAFGVGATSDSMTVPSLLAQKTDSTWLNFGGRAFSSSQELLLFQHFLPKQRRIQKVVLFSGVNDLFLSFLTQDYDRYLGAFYYQNQFREAMSAQKMTKGQRLFKFLFYPFLENDIKYHLISTSELLYRLRRRRWRASVQIDIPSDVGDSEKLDRCVETVERNLITWAILSRELGFSLYYVLQPTSGWSEHKLSDEEQGMFEFLDVQPKNNLQLLNRLMKKPIYEEYSARLAKICKRAKVGFFDMNAEIGSAKFGGRWLFVDRAHLTDLGNDIAATKISDIVQ